MHTPELNNKNYKSDLKQVKTKIPKLLKRELLAEYSATVTYCRHTGVKLVIGTEFQNTSLRSRFLKAEHPIFALPINKLLDVISNNFQKSNPTEKYLLIVAFLKHLKSSSVTESNSILDTSKHPLVLDENAIIKLTNSFYYLVRAYEHWMVGSSTYPLLPSYKVDFALSQDVSALMTFIKRVTLLLEQASYSTNLSNYEFSRGDKLDDELALELQLKEILNSYDASKKPKNYSTKLGKWAIKQLVINAPDLPNDKIASIAYYIQCDSLTLDDDILLEYIKLLESIMPMGELEREQSLLVITHLKSKLDSIYRDLENYGFVILEDEDSLVGNREATEDTKAIAGIKITSKKVTSTKGESTLEAIPKQDRQSYGASDAISRMLAKYGKAKAPTVVREGTQQKDNSQRSTK